MGQSDIGAGTCSRRAAGRAASPRTASPSPPRCDASREPARDSSNALRASLWRPPVQSPPPQPPPPRGKRRSSLVQRPAPTFGTWCSTSGSRPAHEIVDHAFLAGFVEIDGELVAFDAAHEAVAEFLVEHAVAAR